MTFWWWVLVFGGIAVVALALFAVLGLRLWRKATVLAGELGRLSSVVATLEATMQPAGSTSADVQGEAPEPATYGRHRGR